MPEQEIQPYPDVPGDKVRVGDYVAVKLGGEVKTAKLSMIDSCGFRRLLRIVDSDDISVGIYVCQGWIHLDELRQKAVAFQISSEEG